MGELRELNQQNKLAVWGERVAECRASGQSVLSWCKEHGICSQTYYKWQKTAVHPSGSAAGSSVCGSHSSAQRNSSGPSSWDYHSHRRSCRGRSWRSGYGNFRAGAEDVEVMLSDFNGAEKVYICLNGWRKTKNHESLASVLFVVHQSDMEFKKEKQFFRKKWGETIATRVIIISCLLAEI